MATTCMGIRGKSRDSAGEAGVGPQPSDFGPQTSDLRLDYWIWVRGLTPEVRPLFLEYRIVAILHQLVAGVFGVLDICKRADLHVKEFV
jgi:hypothetical protein